LHNIRFYKGRLQKMTRFAGGMGLVKGAALGLAILGLVGCSSPEERAKAHYESGKHLLETGEPVRAVLEFRNALKLNDKLSVAWMLLAQAEEKRQNWPVVAESLTRVTELDPKNFEAFFKLSKLQLSAVKLDAALKNANTANELKANDPNVLALRGAILMRLNDREGAVREAEKALAIDVNNPDAYAVLAADAMAKNQPLAALPFIERGLQADPKNIGLMLFKVKLFENARDMTKLEGALRQMVDMYPLQREFRQGLMSFLLQQHREADVEKELRNYLLTTPTDTAAGLDLVRIVRLQRGAEEGRKELENLVIGQKDLPVYSLALARLDFAEKRDVDGEKTLKDLIDKGEPKETVQQAKLALAEHLRQVGKAKESEDLIKTVIDDDPKNADALTLRAMSRIETNDLSGATTDLRAALDQRPNSVQILMVLAKAYERQGAIDLAVDQYTAALKASNFNSDVTMQYLEMLRRRGNYDAMETVLVEAVGHNVGDERLIATLAELRLNKKNWSGAQEAAAMLLKVNPKSEVAQRVVAAIQLGQKNFDQSIETLKQALDPSTVPSASTMAAMVTAYLQGGKVLEAENFVNSIIAANPKNSDALLLLGTIKQAQRKADEAETYYKKVIDMTPDSATGYFSLARLYALGKRNDEAETVLKQGRAKAPIDLGSSLLLANILETKGAVDEAIAIYEEQLAQSPDVLVLVNNLASLLADYRTDEASSAKAQALAKRLEAVDVPQFKDTVGWLAYKRGDLRVAVSNLETAREKLPELAVVRYHLGLTYADLRRPDDAKRELEKADGLIGPNDPLAPKIAAAMEKIKSQPQGNVQ
jgi:cellulose synthase operon protein C